MSRQYITAGSVIDAVILEKRSFKSFCSKIRIGKVDYALAAETLKYFQLLTRLFSLCDISATALGVKQGILYAMSYELLFGSKKIVGGGAVKRKLAEHYPKLLQALSEEMLKAKAHSPMDLLPINVLQSAAMSKYVRVNELKISLEDALVYVKNTYHATARFDEHVPSLIALPPPSAKGLGEDSYVKDGRLIIQDKASCLPSQILLEQWIVQGCRGLLIDCCAAPGNKTSHLASLARKANALSRDKGGTIHSDRNLTVQEEMIIAFDKSPDRIKLLRTRMKNAGADRIVRVAYQDFLQVNVHDKAYASVTCLLLDPSCSGSGVVRAVERAGESSVENCANFDAIHERLEKLRTFQLSALLHAMSFPAARAITYSTCSLHELENESVVSEALRRSSCEFSSHVSNSRISPLGKWRIEAPRCLQSWSRRGIACSGLSAEEAAKLIRCYPEDGTSGFFVALLVRDETGALEPCEDRGEVMGDDSGIGNHDNGCVNHSGGIVKGRKKNPSETRGLGLLSPGFKRIAPIWTPYSSSAKRFRLYY